MEASRNHAMLVLHWTEVSPQTVAQAGSEATDLPQPSNIRFSPKSDLTAALR
jgi:hypothetical protein